jgi:hypothetical protein
MSYSHGAEGRDHERTHEEAHDLFERRHNEIELILAAYTPDEVWVSTRNDCTNASRIVRRLLVKNIADGSSNGELTTVALDLCVSMPSHYPTKESLCIESLTVADERIPGDGPSSRTMLKAAYNAIPDLIQHCRGVSDSFLGEESVWAVFAAVDDWLTSNRHRFEVGTGRDSACDVDEERGTVEAVAANSEPASRSVTVGRRLIYSHHIISKVKRADLAMLFRELDLTGFVRVGWPGLILIEGVEGSCESFYNTIKRWSWQYLVVRGEMQEPALLDAAGLIPRLLPPYMEVNDLSVISQHCQSVGLEALFRTLMKVYDAPATTAEPNNASAHGERSLYGALVHVDHMNDGRSYRKWLRKTCLQLDVCVMIKECHAGSSGQRSSTRIIVVLLGDECSVRAVLKKWRTSRVDVDAKGKPCLERMLTVLHESSIEVSKAVERLDWDALSVEALLATSFDDASNVLSSIGGSCWVELLSTLFSK